MERYPAGIGQKKGFARIDRYRMSRKPQRNGRVFETGARNRFSGRLQ